MKHNDLCIPAIDHLVNAVAHTSHALAYISSTPSPDPAQALDHIDLAHNHITAAASLLEHFPKPKGAHS